MKSNQLRPSVRVMKPGCKMAHNIQNTSVIKHKIKMDTIRSNGYVTSNMKQLLAGYLENIFSAKCCKTPQGVFLEVLCLF